MAGETFTTRPVQSLDNTVIEDLEELDGFALLGYLMGTGTGVAVSGAALAEVARKKYVVGTEEEIERLPKVEGMFYCTYEE